MRIHFVCHPHGDGGVGDMGGIQVRASEGLALTGVGGIALLGNLLERHTDFRTSFEPVAQPGDIKFVNQTRASIEPKASLTHQM